MSLSWTPPLVIDGAGKTGKASVRSKPKTAVASFDKAGWKHRRRYRYLALREVDIDGETAVDFLAPGDRPPAGVPEPSATRDEPVHVPESPSTAARMICAPRAPETGVIPWISNIAGCDGVPVNILASAEAIISRKPVQTMFREDQYFPVWVHVIVCITMPFAFATAASPFSSHPWNMDAYLITALFTTVVMGVILRMTTLGTPSELRIWFGVFPVFHRVIPLTAIDRWEIVCYRPWRDHYGWGVGRGRNGERYYTTNGNQGVLLTLNTGQTLLIGSQNCENLVRFLDQFRDESPTGSQLHLQNEHPNGQIDAASPDPIPNANSDGTA